MNSAMWGGWQQAGEEAGSLDRGGTGRSVYGEVKVNFGVAIALPPKSPSSTAPEVGGLETQLPLPPPPTASPSACFPTACPPLLPSILLIMQDPLSLPSPNVSVMPPVTMPLWSHE